MADASQNKPKKELIYALIGIVAFLALVLLIGISAFLRPAGDHIEPEPVEAEETVTIDEEVVDTDAAQVPLTEGTETDIVGEEPDAADDTAIVSDTTESTETEVEEPVQSAEEAVAATTDDAEASATVAGEPDTSSQTSENVEVADDMSLGGEEAVTE